METKLRTQPYIKRRDPYICNIKAFLIFLVVFGHAIEPYIDRPEINIIYRLIYTFHMPLFVFVTGMSMKNYRNCKNKFTGVLKMYLICQPLFLLYDYLVNGNIGSIIKPYWHLWYLNALVLWSVMGMGIIWLHEHKINKNGKATYRSFWKHTGICSRSVCMYGGNALCRQQVFQTGMQS